MSCGSLAVQQALLAANVSTMLIESPALAEALRAWLSSQVGIELESHVDNTWYRNHGYGEAVKKDAYLQIRGGRLTLTVTTRDNVGMRLVDYANTGVTVEQVEAFVSALVQAQLQEQLVEALASQYRITSDEPLPNGMRTLQLEV